MQCWRVSMFELLRSKNKDQKHLSSWLRKHFSDPSSDLRLLDTCSAISWQVWSVPTHGPARHRLIRGGGKQHVSSVCILYDVCCTERGAETRMMTIIPKIFPPCQEQSFKMSQKSDIWRQHMVLILLKEPSVGQVFPAEWTAENSTNVLQEAAESRMDCFSVLSEPN